MRGADSDGPCDGAPCVALEFAGDVATSESTYQGIRTLEVTVRAPLPVIGFIGPRALLEVKGHAAIQP